MEVAYRGMAVDDGEMAVMENAAVAPAAGPNLMKVGAGAGAPNAAGRPSAAPVVRTEFPETWIWLNSEIGPGGEVSQSFKVPDTITSWITSAFAVNAADGLGVAPSTAKLQVFRPFFIRLNLPYSVKRGEELALQVLVFNYMDADEWVTVTLDHTPSSGFDFIQPTSSQRQEGTESAPAAIKSYNQRRVQVKGGGGSKSVFFPIIPRKIGELNLKLSAQSSQAGDAIEKPLLVEAEGYRVDVNHPIVIDLSDETEFTHTLRMEFPPNAVQGSERAEFALIGDIMGPVLANVENLVRMPYGCGEQNMLNFVPNIVVVKYLRATHRILPSMEKRAIKYMEAGYQRELTYMREDHSFSAFGKSDVHGSTWLTAFVVRSFRQASPYIFVDEGMVNKSIDYLLSKQKENGEFMESGEVHHKAMQGGSGQGGVPLTAYILIALLENQRSNSEALNYVEQNLDEIKGDVYSLTIAAYALHLADSSMKDKAYQYMLDAGQTEGAFKYWQDSVGPQPSDDERPAYWRRPRSVDVEATAYALLTTMSRQLTSDGLPIVRWLTSKRNPSGGFASTQDTVMALQALAEYAKAAYAPNFDVDISLTNGEHKQSFAVNTDNAILFQTSQLPNLESDVTIRASGSGVVFGQVSWSYHLTEKRENTPFQCDPSVFGKGVNDVVLSLCCKYNRGGKSNMAVLELDALSGYTMEEDQLNSLTTIKDLQRVEVEKSQSKANFYFTSVRHITT